MDRWPRHQAACLEPVAGHTAPVGFNPESIYSPLGMMEDGRPYFGVLRLTPYRITLSGFPDPAIVWTPA